jgi:hypothetical protein
VLSGSLLVSKENLVLAVPMTSNPIQHYDTEVSVVLAEFELFDGVSKKLVPEKMDGWVKCAKVRHWSVQRVQEVVGRATLFYVNKLRGTVADILRAPPLPKGKKGR